MRNPSIGRLMLAVVFSTPSAVEAQEPNAAGCSMCHDQPKTIMGTAHAAVGCQTCHPKHQVYPHPAGIPKPACASCHEEVAARYRLGIHGELSAAGNAAAPDCTVCHGNVHEVKLAGTEAFRQAVPKLCGTCHAGPFDQYEESVHGRAAARGIVAAPVCSSCHRAHMIQSPEAKTSSVFSTRIPETCGRCHGDVRLAAEFNFPRDSLVSYQNSFHGLALREGRETVANCASCHGYHLILRSSNPRSTINPANLPKTCGKCHPGAGANFAIGPIHFVPGQGEPVPVYWVRAAYLTLIPIIIGAMLLYCTGDWLRKIVSLRLRPSGQRTIPARRGALRMYRFERIEHAILIVTFIVLAWTGFALKYPGRFWAEPLMAWESRFPGLRGAIHRGAAAAFIALGMAHLISLARNRNLREHWKQLWPRRGDFGEAAAGFAYNLGLRRTMPRRSPHSWVEKAEYWALVWGAVVMSITGVMLWANTLVLRWLPGVTLFVLTAIHFYEAVLATLAILVWHFYTVIFDPDVYPMDPSWITGYTVRSGEPEDERQ